MYGAGSMMAMQRAAQREKKVRAALEEARKQRENGGRTPTAPTTPSYSRPKLSLFKSSNRSQSSFISTSTFQTVSTREFPAPDARVSPPISPIESVAESPPLSSVQGSAAAAPLPAAVSSPADNPTARRDDRRARDRRSDQQRSAPPPPPQQPPPRNRLRRRESNQRTPPAANPFPPPPKAGSAGRPPSRIEPPRPAANLNVGVANQYGYSVEASGKPKSPSLASRFLSFGSHKSFNSFEAAASSGPSNKIARSASVRSNRTSDPPRSSLDTPTSVDPSVSATTLPSATENDADADQLARKIANRHSVAFPTPNVPEDARYLDSPNALDYLQHSSEPRGANSAATVSTGDITSVHRAGKASASSTTSSRNPAQAHHPSQISLSSIATASRNARTELLGTSGVFTWDSRPPSRQSIEPPSPAHSTTVLRHKASAAPSLNEAMSSSGQLNNSGRESNHQAHQSSSSRDGQYGSNLNVNSNRSGGNHSNSSQTSPMVPPNNSDGPQQRGSTPPPARAREDLTQLDMQQLVSKHEELSDKYRKVKKYYFDKDAQVQQLQNSLAHQRLAQSRTSLDDNEYLTRFNRLDGAINNLAFNIRKEWKAVPRWLAPHVNQDATTIVSKEMTAVGRACISRWIVDEIFDRYFHPSLEPNLSSHLKVIERNLRRFAPQVQTEEDREALLAKISNWRLATLDGLQDMLNSHEANDYRSSLTNILVEMLTSDLMMNLKDPPPPGLDAGVVGIIELAIAIAANLPLESRDVFVDYVMPGMPVNEQFMKPDTTLPPLTNPGEGGTAQPAADSAGGDKAKDGESIPKDAKVRFAAFMSVEVRFKNMLVKAPVYI